MLVTTILCTGFEASACEPILARSDIVDLKSVVPLTTLFTKSSPDLEAEVVVIHLAEISEELPVLLHHLRIRYANAILLLVIEKLASEEMLLDCFEAGIKGYLTHDQIIPHLEKAVRVLNEGEAWIPRNMVAKILDRLAGSAFVQTETNVFSEKRTH